MTDVMEEKKEGLKFRDKDIIELTEIVVFRAGDNKHQQPVKVSPCEDSATGRIFTGQGRDGYYDSLSEEDKRYLSYIVESSLVVTITDGKVLRPTSNADRENWRWIQLHPYISLTKAAMSSSRSAVYYIENRKAEAEKRVQSAKAKDKARYLIQFELSFDKQVRVAKAIGHPAPGSFSPAELQDYLLNQTETMAAAIIDACDPKKSEQTGTLITFHDLVKWRIIEKFRGGTFKFGGEKGTFVGHNEFKVTEFLKDPRHTEIVAAMLALLEEKKATLGASETGQKPQEV